MTLGKPCHRGPPESPSDLASSLAPYADYEIKEEASGDEDVQAPEFGSSQVYGMIETQNLVEKKWVISGQRV